MPLPYNVSRVLSFFNRKVIAYDLVGQIVDYKMQVSKSNQYSFLGVLIPPTDSDLTLFDEGERQVGAMVLYVGKNVELSIADSMSSNQKPFRQTIIIFKGNEYRVRGCSDREEDGLHRKYTLVRYIGGRVVKEY